MHDVKKTRQTEIDEKKVELERQKISKFKELYGICFKARDDNVLNRTVLKDLDRLLEVNPENYTMWNYRRRVLQYLWQAHESSAPTLAVQEGDASPSPNPKPVDLKRELQFTFEILRKDYKVYAVWLHRRWVILQLEPTARFEALTKDCLVCEGLLAKDERNFHAWGYLRWVCSELAKIPHPNPTTQTEQGSEAELKIAMRRIKVNFSNYSAWHNRALALQSKYQSFAEDSIRLQELAEEVTEELDLIEKAAFCDPADQSAWLYGAWIADLLFKLDPVGFSAKRTALLESMELLIEEVSLDEKVQRKDADALLGLKWPLWFQLQLHLVKAEGTALSEETKTSIDRLLTKLLDVDPGRHVYYTMLKNRCLSQS
jgi:geranylgeranyl transferase type-2 subunit alpha